VKVKKFRLAKAVVLASAVALVIAALVFTLASAVTGPTKSPKFILTSGTGFTITSAVYPSPACSGTPALLYPGITRCAVFSVHNSLTVPITVLTITTALDGSYPAPPAICAGANLTLPNFSGSFTVAGGASANSPGVPIALNDSGTNQDACENLTYHFVFSGTATYTDATTTVLASSTNPSVSGHSVTFTATVTANNASSDPSLPSRTVTFYSCPSASCASTTSLGTGTIGAGGQATFSTFSLRVGTTYVEAVYVGVTGSFSASTSNIVTQEVVSLPSRCTGRYTNWFFGNPGFPNITGTNGDDFIYAFGGNYRVHDFNGDDCCFYAGNGNNWLSDGNGNNVALAGDGNNVFTLGNGNDQIIVGNGTNTIGAGNGSDLVTVGNGSHNDITLGSGSDSVTLGSGSYNGVALGSGTDSVTIEGGSYDQINAGAGNETIYLGAGTYNTYNGAAHHTNICHLPAPPASWHGTVAGYYHDTVTNCTVVTP
jgi:Ca2+-binding RTX toxin-like protein